MDKFEKMIASKKPEVTSCLEIHAFGGGDITVSSVVVGADRPEANNHTRFRSTRIEICEGSYWEAVSVAIYTPADEPAPLYSRAHVEALEARIAALEAQVAGKETEGGPGYWTPPPGVEVPDWAEVVAWMPNGSAWVYEGTHKPRRDSEGMLENPDRLFRRILDGDPAMAGQWRLIRRVAA